MSIECVHLTSRRPCWRSTPVFWELNSVFMQNLPFVSNNQYGRWSRERTHSIMKLKKSSAQIIHASKLTERLLSTFCL